MELSGIPLILQRRKAVWSNVSTARDPSERYCLRAHAPVRGYSISAPHRFVRLCAVAFTRIAEPFPPPSPSTGSQVFVSVRLLSRPLSFLRPFD